ncbi:hypothetical protein Agub_g1483, partial [Astrephomene gubernaculifera]
ALAGVFEAALDAKKHAARPHVPPEVEARCRALPDPGWHRKYWRAQQQQQQQQRQAAPQQQPAQGCSVISDLFARIGADEEQLRRQSPLAAAILQEEEDDGGDESEYSAAAAGVSRATVTLGVASLHVDGVLLQAARSVVHSDEQWQELLDRCWAVVQREWSAPWRRYLTRKTKRRGGGGGDFEDDDSDEGVTASGGGGGVGPSSREALRRQAAAGAAFQTELVRAVRRGLLEAARGILPGRLQLGDTVYDGSEASAVQGSLPGSAASATVTAAATGTATALATGDELDMRSRTALATALYASVYGRRRAEGGSSGAGERLGVVWLAAGPELNWAHWVLRHGGRLPGVRRGG